MTLSLLCAKQVCAKLFLALKLYATVATESLRKASRSQWTRYLRLGGVGGGCSGALLGVAFHVLSRRLAQRRQKRSVLCEKDFSFFKVPFKENKSVTDRKGGGQVGVPESCPDHGQTHTRSKEYHRKRYS